MKSITTVSSDSDSITLKKGAKGKYTWEIKVYGDTSKDMINKVENIDNILKSKYPSEE